MRDALQQAVCELYQKLGRVESRVEALEDSVTIQRLTEELRKSTKALKTAIETQMKGNRK